MVVITHQNAEAIMRKNKDGEINVYRKPHIRLLGLIPACGRVIFLSWQTGSRCERCKQNAFELAIAQSSW